MSLLILASDRITQNETTNGAFPKQASFPLRRSDQEPFIARHTSFLLVPKGKTSSSESPCGCLETESSFPKSVSRKPGDGRSVHHSCSTEASDEREILDTEHKSGARVAAHRGCDEGRQQRAT
jgi:hypothetical protein